jgi:hypothetical protein
MNKKIVLKGELKFILNQLQHLDDCLAMDHIITLGDFQLDA